jgi:hypothetical protein
VVTVIVATPPKITKNPTTINVNNGLNATFEIDAIGTEPLSYQWYKDNVLIAGQTRKTITLTNVGIANQGLYKCKAINPHGSAESNNANLIINVGGPPTIITQPSNVNTNPTTNPSFTVVANGTLPLSYQWYKDNNIIAGATSSVYNLTNVTNADEGTFNCKVSNPFGSIKSNYGVLNVNDGSAPTIIAQPKSLNINNGSIATFSVEAKGDIPLSYEWYKDGVLISGANSKIYSINNVQASHVGIYKCKVSNVFGNVESVLVGLTVNIGNPPTITSHPAAATVNVNTPVTFTVVANGTAPLTYKWYKNSLIYPGTTDTIFINNVTKILPLSQ